MQAVANLIAFAAKTDIGKRPAPKIHIDPVCHYPLVYPSKLTCSGQNPATVDPDRKAERFTVFESDYLGGQLCAAI